MWGSEVQRAKIIGAYGSSVAYRVDNIEVLLLDTAHGRFMNPEICLRGGECQCSPNDLGMYNPLVTSNMTLHPDECYHPDLRWELRGKSHDEIVEALKELLAVFSNVTYIRGRVDPGSLRFIPEKSDVAALRDEPRAR